ncbi:helix-turn-helix domain-containing protein [Pseudoalteromonas rubra]|uniref:helix-turn-helix domain-containing protein n=1 Tax=Pseudoalteromonas rubra TaxID=43658 RepID=UPI000F76FA05|nr:AraC family transcriptional regulator [Pseudoalteromonas rubra]
MKTIYEHTQSNVLVIPQALFAMKDVAVLCHHRNSAVFYKSLEQDLVNIEFYTNTPCFIFIEHGKEAITNSNNDMVELRAGAAVFLPQGLNLQSDFVKETDALRAYLVFFDDDVVSDYLSKVKGPLACDERNDTFVIPDGGDEFAAFFASIRAEITTSAYLNVKLQELLHLIAWRDNQHIFNALLATRKRIPAKQNLARMLQTLDVLHLSVSDLAQLCGRSLSSFNRDFKESYQMTPKKWLREKKLAKAKALLAGNELSVTQVAMAVGYDNVSAFIKAFKLKYGVTPKQIKR